MKKNTKWKYIPEEVFTKDCLLLAKDYIENTSSDDLVNFINSAFSKDPQMFLDCFQKLKGKRYIDKFGEEEYKD